MQKISRSVQMCSKYNSQIFAGNFRQCGNQFLPANYRQGPGLDACYLIFILYNFDDSINSNIRFDLFCINIKISRPSYDASFISCQFIHLLSDKVHWINQL